MRFKNSLMLTGAGRARAWHHHGSDKPTSTRAIYVLKSANGGLFYTPLYFLALAYIYILRKSIRINGFHFFTIEHP